MTRADLDYLINGIVNGLGGSGGFGRGYTGGGSSIGRGAVGRDISGADFDKEENRHNKAMDDIVDSNKTNKSHIITVVYNDIKS